MSASVLSKNIKAALNVVGAKTEVANTAQSVLPTAKTRAALELLSISSPEKLAEDEVNLRELLNDLFSWDGKNKVNKALIREFREALNTEGKYAHAVELTGFLSALAPLLEPDRLARLYTAAKEADSVYSPIKYTLQLSAVLKKVFSRFSEERIERLAHSLWVDTHQGNWWDITLGPQKNLPTMEGDNTEWTARTAENALLKGELHWSEKAAAAVRTIKPSAALTAMFIDYRNRLNKGEVLPTEPSLFSSYIPWLKINERPESPVFSLLNILQLVMEAEQYITPKKPREFRELFPPIEVQLISAFPLPTAFARAEQIPLPEGAEAVLISDAQKLASNANYMGNCTMSYRNSMERGTYALFRVNYEGRAFNVALTERSGRWGLGELNSRHNRGNVPTQLRQAFQRYVDNLVIDKNDGIIDRTILANYEDRKIQLIS